MDANALDEKRAIDRMIRLVRARPTITVREIAAEFGYSEEGSVYYWLRKSGYQGLRDLKRVVLQQAASQIPPALGAVREGETPYPGEWIMTMHTEEYAPWIVPGDRLRIAADRKPDLGDLVAVDLPARGKTLWRFLPGPPARLLHPARPKESLPFPGASTTGSDGTLLGVVVELIRPNP